ncbi:MAG: hypothetical protein AMXMBFR67_02240 [Nitrospira sp.]
MKRDGTRHGQDRLLERTQHVHIGGLNGNRRGDPQPNSKDRKQGPTTMGSDMDPSETKEHKDPSNWYTSHETAS